MPRWIYTAPPDSCAKSEQAVAAFFSALGPEFSIRWGFPYEDNGSVWREGDFIIQGPHSRRSSHRLNPMRSPEDYPSPLGSNLPLDRVAVASYVADNNTRQASAQACSNWRVTFFREKVF